MLEIIKELSTRLAVWYLRKRKVSVIMNVKIETGCIRQLTKTCYIYDNELIDTRYYDFVGAGVALQDGKFVIVRQKESEDWG